MGNDDKPSIVKVGGFFFFSKSLLLRFQKTEAYQIFFVRVHRKKYASLTLYLLWILLLVPGLVTLEPGYRRIYPLEEMNKEIGVLVKYKTYRKSRDILYVKNVNGEVVKFYTQINDKSKIDLEKIIGEKAIYYHEKRFVSFRFVDYVYEVESYDKKVFDYSYDIRVELSESVKRFSKVFISISFLPVLGLWWINRKEDSVS